MNTVRNEHRDFSLFFSERSPPTPPPAYLPPSVILEGEAGRRIISMTLGGRLDVAG